MYDIYSAICMPSHLYSLVMVKNGRSCYSKDFGSRQNAERKMYSIMGKEGISTKKVWDDKHFKTYFCTDGTEFHINRL